MIWECNICSNLGVSEHPCVLPDGWEQDNQGDGQYCSECHAKFLSFLTLYRARARIGYGYEYPWGTT
jgi:hypothetical protein